MPHPSLTLPFFQRESERKTYPRKTQQRWWRWPSPPSLAHRGDGVYRGREEGVCMGESNALTRQFDDAAELYDEVRPRSPETIVEQTIAFAGLPAQGRIFEVGCGTGQMTLPFAQRGYTMVAIDQGER